MKNRVIILGGGASGLAAAVTAAKNPENAVSIVEKNPRVGKKILASGNGRCNLSNAGISAEKYSESGFFREWNERCPPERTLGFFAELGLPLFSDSEGRIYPATNSAASVLDVLRLRAKMLGIREQTATEIIEVKKTREGFLLTDRQGKGYCCDSLVIACGSSAGGAAVNSGLINSLAALGHKFHAFTPALAPLVTGRSIGALKGTRQKAAFTLFSGGSPLGSFSGEVQFRDRSLSGIAIFEAAFCLNKFLKGGGKATDLVLSMDFLPHISNAQLTAELDRRKAEGYLKDGLLTGLVTNRLAAFIEKDKQGLSALKACRFPLTGTEDTEAQVCDGGFDLEGIEANMQSKIHKGLFFTGECLNFSGDCGGYNLHAAWSTGIIAGEALCGD